jgi:tetratricopeptide (TPR) repeat protein
MSPLARLAQAVAVLGLFAWVLIPSSTPPPDPEAEQAEAWMMASRDAFAAGRWDEALGPTQSLVERFPTQQVYADRLARIHFNLDRPSDEAAAWERYVLHSPTPEDACPAIGNAYLRAGERVRALNAFERCRDFDPMSAELWYFLGRAYQQAGEHERALEVFTEAVRVDPQHSDSRIGLASVLLGRNDPAAALEAVTPAVARVPENPDVHLLQGLAHQRLGQPLEARTALERAAALTDSYVDVHVAIGVLDYTEGRLAEARARFDRALALAPGRRVELQVWLDRLREATP